jgi:hypothetical protein
MGTPAVISQVRAEPDSPAPGQPVRCVDTLPAAETDA